MQFVRMNIYCGIKLFLNGNPGNITKIYKHHRLVMRVILSYPKNSGLNRRLLRCDAEKTFALGNLFVAWEFYVLFWQ